MSCSFDKEFQGIKESINKLEKEVNMIAKLPIIQEALDKQVSEDKIAFRAKLERAQRRAEEIHAMMLMLNVGHKND